MANTLGRQLARMSEDQRQTWAACVLERMTDVHTLALDMAGWKIICKNDPTHCWPFLGEAIDCKAPNWCQDPSDQ